MCSFLVVVDTIHGFAKRSCLVIVILHIFIHRVTGNVVCPTSMWPSRPESLNCTKNSGGNNIPRDFLRDIESFFPPPPMPPDELFIKHFQQQTTTKSTEKTTTIPTTTTVPPTTPYTHVTPTASTTTTTTATTKATTITTSPATSSIMFPVRDKVQPRPGYFYIEERATPDGPKITQHPSLPWQPKSQSPPKAEPSVEVDKVYTTAMFKEIESFCHHQFQADPTVQMCILAVIACASGVWCGETVQQTEGVVASLPEGFQFHQQLYQWLLYDVIAH